MPWIDEKKCTGCGICIERCPVNAIKEEEGKAKINMNECIHCGTCHDVCSQEAVRHDGEKIPENVKANVEMTKKSDKHIYKVLHKSLFFAFTGNLQFLKN